MNKENQFYNHAMEGLINATAKRKSLEENFSRDKISVYNETCEEQISYAVELLKIGVDSELKNGKVTILAEDGSLIEFEEKELRDNAGEETFMMLFPAKEEKEPDQDEDDDLYDREFEIKNADNSKGQSPENIEDHMYPGVYQAYQNMVTNPFSVMFPWMMQIMQPQFMAPQSRPQVQVSDTAGMKTDPLKDVKTKMDNLVESKEKMRQKAIYYKDKYKQAEKNFSDALRENEELDAVATENMKKAEEEKNKIVKELDSLQNSVRVKENKISKYESELKELRVKLENSDTLNKEIQEKARQKIKTLNDEIEQSRQSLNEKENEITLKLKEIVTKSSEIEKLNDEIKERDQKLQRLSDKAKKTEEQLIQSTQIEEQLKKRISELENTNNQLKLQMESKKKENENLNQKLSLVSESSSKDKKKVDELQRTNEDLHNKNEEYRKKNTEFEKQKSDIERGSKQKDDKISQLKKENSDLKDEIVTLKKVAYFDHSFEVGNVSGFYKRINNKKNMVRFVAAVDVCGMKNINEEYKEEIGDNVIQYTIDALAEAFGKENIYRMRGAQFLVLMDNGSYSKTRETIEDVKNTLAKEKEFDIVYGLASFDRDANRNEAVGKAKNAMNEMKSKWDEKQLTESMQYASPEYEGAGYIQAGHPDDMNHDETDESKSLTAQERDTGSSANGNPNINMDLLNNDPYKDDKTIKEVDATEINLANQIMQMVNDSESA